VTRANVSADRRLTVPYESNVPMSAVPPLQTLCCSRSRLGQPRVRRLGRPTSAGVVADLQTALIHGLTWAHVRILVTSPAILRTHTVPMVRTTPTSRPFIIIGVLIGVYLVSVGIASDQ
jgi:hypothetical protein